MPLTPGSTLGPYQILTPLGAGGMGEVYKARDTRLDRIVAIKVLPEALADHPELRQRLEREAKAISSLNHPNICTLFDIGEATPTDPGVESSGDESTVRYLVMEYLEGETLADRLARGALPLDEALELGAQIAEALGVAHRQGVMHRDLKPGNVMLTKGGAKLLDFGLAKEAGLAGPSDLTASPTLTQPLTSDGAIVGTFQYMAPEQLEGRDVDERSDIFGLGATLYEMLTGTKAFAAESQASLIAAIMKEEPRSLSEVLELAPRSLDRLVRRCLAKDPDRRWQSAADVADELRWVGESATGLETRIEHALEETVGFAGREKIAWLLVLLLPLVVWLLQGRSDAGPASVTGVDGPLTLAVVPPEGVGLSVMGDYPGPPVLSPDGTMLAFSAVADDGRSHLWVHDLARAEARELAGTAGAYSPFWSPDGQSLGFFADVALKRVDLAGGQPLTLARAEGSGKGGTWSRAGVIVYSPQAAEDLYAIPSSGGERRAVTARDSSRHTTYRWPQFLPDGRHFIYLAAHHDDPFGPATEIRVGSVDGDTNAAIGPADGRAVFAAGTLLFPRGGGLLAQPFDPVRLELVGQASPTGLDVLVDLTTWHTDLSASETGLLTFIEPGPVGGYSLRWYDRDGTPRELAGPESNYQGISLSADATRVLAETQFDRPTSDIWLFDLETGGQTRLTIEDVRESDPHWGPGSDQFTYAKNSGDGHAEIFVGSLAGGGQPWKLLGVDGRDSWPWGWSADGRFLLLGQGYIFSDLEQLLMVFDTETGTTHQLLEGNAVEAGFSPDHRWVVFSAEVSGRNEIFVARFDPPDGDSPPTLAGRWQLSQGGGTRPLWRPDGREVFYTANDGTFMAVQVDADGEAFRILGEEPLFKVLTREDTSAYGVTADGARFLLTPLSAGNTKPIPIVVNWPQLLGVSHIGGAP